MRNGYNGYNGYKVSGIVLAALLSLPMASYAADECVLDSGGVKNGSVFAGATTCNKISSAAVSVNGPLTINDSTIANVIVNGPTHIDNSTVSNITGNGPIDLNKAKVGKAVVKGVIEAKDSDFKEITINGKLALTDSTVGNIVMKNSMFSKEKDIYLKGATKVSGNITFTQTGGVVYVDKSASVSGKVIGGKVEKVAE